MGGMHDDGNTQRRADTDKFPPRPPQPTSPGSPHTGPLRASGGGAQGLFGRGLRLVTWRTIQRPDAWTQARDGLQLAEVTARRRCARLSPVKGAGQLLAAADDSATVVSTVVRARPASLDGACRGRPRPKHKCHPRETHFGRHSSCSRSSIRPHQVRRYLHAACIRWVLVRQPRSVRRGICSQLLQACGLRSSPNSAVPSRASLSNYAP